MNAYDPRTDEITLDPDASLYVRLHELAHQEQYRNKSWVFRVVLVLRCIRGLNYLATLWIEFDALRRARSVMQTMGVWTDDAEQEARRSFYTYVRRKELA